MSLSYHARVLAERTAGRRRREAIVEHIQMSYAEHWFAVAARIQGLKRAVELFFQIRERDIHATGTFLQEQCKAALNSIEEFRNAFASSLPSEAETRLRTFPNNTFARDVQTARPLDPVGAAIATLIGLVALEAEVTFILTGRQEQIRARSERAFLHLKRTLAVDPDVKKRWSEAFQQDELECEKLGSVHLLSHGIYAFKVDAKGARTDLVFAEPRDLSLLERSVEGLVLTEWKTATTVDEARTKIAEAREQAKLYVRGALAGIELTGYRYLCVVSGGDLDLPPDTTSEGIVYRHINIAVNPRVPSRVARERARKSK